MGLAFRLLDGCRGHVACRLALLVPGTARADHESVGTVVWVGEGEVVLVAEGHYHVLAIPDRTAVVDEFGRSIEDLRMGDTVRESCRPTADGGFTAARIEIVRAAGPHLADLHT